MEKLEKIAVKDIRTNPFQPRKVFDQEKLEELAQSIKENGLICLLYTSDAADD